jgi:hypothetical protein
MVHQVMEQRLIDNKDVVFGASSAVKKVPSNVNSNFDFCFWSSLHNIHLANSPFSSASNHF